MCVWFVIYFIHLLDFIILFFYCFTNVVLDGVIHCNSDQKKNSSVFYLYSSCVFLMFILLKWLWMWIIVIKFSDQIIDSLYIYSSHLFYFSLSPTYIIYVTIELFTNKLFAQSLPGRLNNVLFWLWKVFGCSVYFHFWNRIWSAFCTLFSCLCFSLSYFHLHFSFFLFVFFLDVVCV